MSHAQDHDRGGEEPTTHYREHSEHSPRRRTFRRGASDLEHRRGRHISSPEDAGEFATRRLIDTVMDRSDRPLTTVVNFGDVKMDDADDAAIGRSSASAPNVIVFNGPGAHLDMTGSTSSTSIVDSRALRQRMTRGRPGLSYVTVPRRIGMESTYPSYAGADYNGGRVDVPLRRPERMVGFERGGGGRSGKVMDVCLVCETRAMVNRRGCCDRCNRSVLSFPALKDRYETDRDGLLDYSTIRSPLWDDFSDVSYSPTGRDFRYRGNGKYGAYDSDVYY